MEDRRQTSAEAPADVTASPALLRIGCVRGVQPDKWQRRWQENCPHYPTEWDFLDSRDQWPALAQGDCQLTLLRMVVPQADESVLERLSYGREHGVPPTEDSRLVADLENLQVVELYREELALVARQHHDISVVDRISAADVAALEDPLVGRGELTVPAGHPEMVLEYAASGAGVAMLPLPLVRALGLHKELKICVRPVDMEPVTRICAGWLPSHCDEEVAQEFVGMLRGRRAASARSASRSAEQIAAERKKARQERIKASRQRSQAQRERTQAARRQARRKQKRR